MKRFFNWLRNKLSPRKASRDSDLHRTGSHLRRTGAHVAPGKARPAQALPQRQPEVVDANPRRATGAAQSGLIRNKYVREDTGTHETLKILDDSIIDTEEDEGIDPYNTGQFDRSKNWDKRTK